MDFEENNLEVEVDEPSIDQDYVESNAKHDDYFDNDDMKDDYLFDIPELSRIILYFGNSLNDKEWMCQKVKSDFDLNYMTPTIALKEPFKFMSSKFLESNEALNDHLDNFIFELKNFCQENDTDSNADQSLIKDIADEDSLTTRMKTKTVVETLYAGRIRYGMTNGQLNPQIIQLEGPFSLNRGEIIPLDLSLFKNSPNENGELDFSLFPGKIVILKGQNFTGNYISVTKFIDYAKFIVPDFPLKCPPVLLGQHSFNIICACGSFVKFDPHSNKKNDPTDTSYMQAIADYLKKYNPDVLLLFGPFFDESQLDAIQKWSLQDTLVDNSYPYQWSLERLIQHQIRALMDIIESRSIHTKIVIIPSSNELGQANVYPMYPMENKFAKEYSNVRSYSNPALLNIGGISFGVTSTDILLHLSRKEINNIKSTNTKIQSERLERLCGHIISHRHFYPLLPPDQSVNMEYPLYHHLSMVVTPHILVIPSMLRPFVYNINGTIVINPGKIIKNTIARIMFEPFKNEKDYSGSLYQYTNVEIIKLKH
ncbi:DNA polymerase alpha subunit B [Dermatophagoides farinae]|uniref:DNA polymerase alpha subunit B n=1 Tax=Dermatophagoides farinae TaxID=6954 RepID=A0A922IEE9_DERFA|nr:DNA polymerase alpha subunit B-like [Dermatophagoides farinae]KAH7642068.1 dna polymerase alpha subunit b-like protein [Dermatophagoides farinae]KAH9529202.1 DNA polymerase alpha subunit B [Dermatophagoides farinae]